MSAKKELQVSAIVNGTVIDHIPASRLFDVINVLGLDTTQSTIAFGTNFESKQQGRKAIIKIWDRFLEDNEINKLALVAPDAKINIIKDYDVVEKKMVHVPETIEGIVKCVNPKCITNQEYVKTRFKVVNTKPIALKCHYCEKLTEEGNIVVI
ncbi:MAG: aspartate carbamoyltransferase regulatory subunit [Marinifilaceae bacterium]